MKFLIDAHLPPGLRAVFRAAGHDAIHTLDLPDQNAARDVILNEVSMNEQRVVVTKDTISTTPICCMVVRGSWCW